MSLPLVQGCLLCPCSHAAIGSAEVSGRGLEEKVEGQPAAESKPELVFLVHPGTSGAWPRSWQIPLTQYTGQEASLEASRPADCSSSRSTLTLAWLHQGTQYQAQYWRLPEGGAVESCGQ